MKILLHTCCAPCLIYPLKRLRQDGFETEVFFYNPNIHPLPEYNSRKAAVEDYAKESGLKLDCPQYLAQEFFNAVNLSESAPKRCHICWGLRLRKSAEAAKAKGCTHFTSTLLVSPYQDQETLKRLGEQAAKETGVEFFYEDFRPGFKEAHAEAKAKGIYCQKYCGCIYSEIERYSKKK